MARCRSAHEFALTFPANCRHARCARWTRRPQICCPFAMGDVLVFPHGRCAPRLIRGLLARYRQPSLTLVEGPQRHTFGARGNHVVRVRHLSRVLSQRRPDGCRGICAILCPGRCRGALGSRRGLARGAALPTGALGRLRTPGRRQRHRRTNAAPEGRHCRAGAALVPSLAIGRGGRNARPHQRRTPHLRYWPQRLSTHLRGLWRPLRREPRALCRGARGPQALLEQ